MATSSKWLLLTIAAMLAIIGYQHKQLQDTKSQLTKIIDQKDIGGGITRSSTTIGTSSDIDSMAADAGVDISRIRSDAHQNGAVVTGINVTTANTSGSTSTNIGSSRTKPRTDKTPTPSAQCVCSSPNLPTAAPPSQDAPDKTGEKCTAGLYDNSEQILDIEEPIADQKIPFGEVSFKSWQKDPWSLSIFPRTYKSTIVFAEDDDGRKLAYSHMEIIQGENKAKLPITTAEMIIAPKPAKFRWSNRLHLGLSIGVQKDLDVASNLGLAFYVANYGSDKMLPDFVFIGGGLGYDFLNVSPTLSLNPVAYRVGQHIPFVHDLYISPQFTLNLALDFGFLLTLSTAL